LQVNANELKEIVGAYKDTGKVYADGVHVAGKRYVVHKADGRSIYGKQVSTFPHVHRGWKTNSRTLQGKEGILIVKTVQAILICHYPETVQPGNAALAVEQLADYLTSVGY